MNYAPDGYNTITPYLIVPNAAQFISFMQEVFGAELLTRHMRDETITMHAELKVGDSLIMLADSTPEYAPMPAGIFIYVKDADTTFSLALEKGAMQVTPVSDQSYGRSGGVKDAFGNTWWITSVPGA